MKSKRTILPVIALCVCFVFVGCAKKAAVTTTNTDNTKAAVDYSMAARWLSLPAPVKPVDIFYICPTAWKNKDKSPQISAIDDPTLITGAKSAFGRQATAFETVGNIYAPYYRQDNLSATDRLKVIAGTPTSDIVAAFDYYIKHYNDGRPFILVGHSQGADVLSNLLAGYMKENPDVYKNMIAAYVLGFPITAEYLAANPHLKFAEGPDDTGVIISYNTEGPTVSGPNPVLSGMIGIVINPITWTRDETLATKEQGLGSYMPNIKGVFSQTPQYADAKIDKAKGVLICSTANKLEFDLIDMLAGFPDGVYHPFDIPFYYYNLRENAGRRADNFLKK